MVTHKERHTVAQPRFSGCGHKKMGASSNPKYEANTSERAPKTLRNSSKGVADNIAVKQRLCQSSDPDRQSRSPPHRRSPPTSPPQQHRHEWPRRSSIDGSHLPRGEGSAPSGHHDRITQSPAATVEAGQVLATTPSEGTGQHVQVQTWTETDPCCLGKWQDERPTLKSSSIV